RRGEGGRVTADAWRGIAAEDADQLTAGVSALLRRRARRLLTDLLRPHKRMVTRTLLLVVTANLAALTGPWLVGVGIDQGIPPLVHGGDPLPLALIVAGFFAAVAVQAVTTRAFVGLIGRLGEDVVLELRQRLFAHFQRLPVAFHERYTSGRVISRQTSDIDSISDLFEEGLDSLVSAVFSLLLVGVGMLLLDWPLALVVLLGFGPLTALTLWFRRESALAYRRSREAIADVIVAFVETFGGIRAVQAFRRERRNEEIFSMLNGRNAAATLRSMRLLRCTHRGSPWSATWPRAPCCCTGGCAWRTATSRWAYSPPSCCTCSVSSTRCKTCRSSTTRSSPPVPRWRRSPGCSTSHWGCPSPRSPWNCRPARGPAGNCGCARCGSGTARRSYCRI